MRIFFVVLFLVSGIITFAKPKTSQARIDSLLAKLPGMEDDTSKVNALYTISDGFLNTNPSKGMEYGKRMLVLSRDIGWTKGEADAFVVIGSSYFRTGDLPVALELYFKALKLYEEIRFLPGVFQCYSNIAGVYSNRRNYKKALEYASRGLQIAKVSGDSASFYTAKGNIGIIQKDNGDFAEALENMIKAMRWAERKNDSDSYYSQVGNIGSVYYKMGELERALEYRLNALNYAKKVNDKYEISYLSSSVGAIYLDFAKFGMIASSGSRIPKGKRQQLEIAVGYYNEAAALAEEIKDFEGAAHIYNDLASSQQLMGDFELALENYANSVFIKDSLYSSANSEKIANLETKRQIELKDKDIKIAELEVAKKRNERGFFIGGIILLLLAMVIVIKNIQRKKLQEKQAAQLKTMIDTQESERKRISRDLHDDIGTKLSALGLFLSSMKEKAVESENIEIISLAQSSQQFIREAVYDLRELLLDLSPSVLEDFGYTTAVEGLINKINETKLIHFSLVIFGMKERLQHNYELALYRITQELINNVLKHSEAKKVTLQIGRREDLIILMIEDDGKGFELLDYQEGYGLKNLSSRTALLQGKMIIDSAPGKGTSVLIEIPYHSN